jgi:phosphorylcholine metabolism protein LicD
MSQVNVIGKKLNQKQKRFIHFIQYLKEYDKSSLITLPYNKEMFVDIIEKDYYDDTQRESLLELRKKVDILLFTNDRLKRIYQGYMQFDISTAGDVLVEARLEDYFNKMEQKLN